MLSLFKTRTAAASFCCLVLAGSCILSASAASTVTIVPGESIEAAVKANPAGTTFLIQTGFYRGQSIIPKAGDTFTGQGDVRFMGSDVLSFVQSEIYPGLWVANATPINTFHGTCQHTSPLCGYPQELYIDNQVQTPVATPISLTPGSWYFDRVNGLVYIASDPGVHTIEIGQLPYAFSGNVENVTVTNILVERYANFSQSGAIGGQVMGTGWVVSNCEVRFNHGAGVELGSGSKILNSFIHNNGELGIALGGTGSQAIGNEISYNNFAGNAFSWESGGSKFSNTTNLLLQGNNVHDNLGPGLWLDTGNTGAIVENNTITNNEFDGIQHELGYAIIIRNNVLSGNGTLPCSWLWNGQILVNNSSNAEIYGNTITVPTTDANGISIINQNRGDAPDGVPYVSKNNNVYDNTITYLSAKGGTGQVNDTGSHPVNGNSFHGNHYILTTGTAADKHWWWFGPMTWADFLATGQEVGGTLVVK